MAFFGDKIKPEQLNELVRIIENITSGDIDSRISISGASESLAPVLHALQELQIKEKKLKASETLFKSKMDAILTSTVNGKLDARISFDSLPEGSLRTTSENVNAILDAVVAPLKTASSYVERIAKGDIPPVITDTYNGDFNTIKNNLNTCINAISSMVAEAANLERAAIDGKLATRADASKYQGDYRKVVEGVNNCLDAVINPLNVAANYVDRIAKGDIPPAITDTYNGDFNTIKNNLNLAIDAINEQAATAQAIAYGDLTIKVNVRSKNDEVGKSLLQIVEVLQGLLKELQTLTVASTEGQLSARGKPEQFNGAYADVVKGINEMLNAVATPMKVTSDYIDQIAKGIIPATITTDYKGEYLVIRNNLNGLIQVMSDLLKQTDIIIHAAADGELDKRANADLFQGGWKQLVIGVNDTVTNIVNPLNVTADYVEQIANGVIPPVITIEYKGQYNVIKNNLNNAVKTMSDLLKETDILIQGAAVGELDKRANADIFQGGWKQLVVGVNDTVKNIAEPMKVTSDYINQIANGIIPAQITTDYKGEYLVIRDNLNALVKMMGDLLKETDILIQGAAVGELDKRANADMFQGGWKQLVVGVNDTVKNIAEPMKVTSDYINQIASGIIPAQITTDYKGEYLIIRNNLNGLLKMMSDLLNETGSLIEGAANGDLNKRANAAQFQGGWNALVVGVNQIVDGIVLPVNEAVDVLKEMEKGDLTKSVKGDYKGQLKDFKDTVNNTIEKLSQVISEVNGAASNIASASEEVSATAQNMSQAASEQASSVEETSASVEQMSASINQNTENAKVTDGMATQASTEAVQGGEAVKETVHAMKSIAGKIGIIDDIAYQTNLLALNAAIEAARAGEHGKGFAVVAAEVRKLAERSQIAAQEIGELAESSVDRAESAGKLLDTIVPSIKKTSDLVQEIAAASEEQSSGVSQINVAVNQLNQVTQQNAASSEELAATSEQMSAQAAQLQELMSFFTVEGSTKTAKRKPAVKKTAVSATKHIHDEDEFVQF